MRQPWALAKMVSDERDEEGNSVFLLLAAAGDEDAVRCAAGTLGSTRATQRLCGAGPNRIRTPEGPPCRTKTHSNSSRTTQTEKRCKTV